ncbi:sensor histidine kinase [Hutsoniella sourekii]|uniref:sensor histidine kinase n=1 Tax=Hutsoniella sourekii TaxID=87650 RepID=UPI000488B72E|nr:HAMP domain-containing sensor histidine kinase [Hutsoniella sourekii]
MKFLWQQLLGFFVVIIVILAFLSSRIENYMVKQIENTREEQLLNYGRNIVNNNFSRTDLIRASQLLASEEIIIQVYLEDGRTIYPLYDPDYDAPLSQEELAILNSGQQLGFRRTDRRSVNGELKSYLTVYLPHSNVGEFPSGFISLAAPLSGLEEQLSAVRENILVSFIISSLIGLAISLMTALYQNRKISRLQVATKKIASGNYAVNLDTTGTDEFGDLARDFEVMAQSLAASQEEIKRQEELRSQFMMDVAHEMRTPLTTMAGLIEGLQYNMIPEKQRGRSLELISKETKRLTRLVNENLDYEKIRSHQFTLTKRLIDGQQLFKQVQEQMNVKAKENNNQVTIEAPEGLTFWADYDRLVQIIINLVTNAIQFSKDSEILLKGQMLAKESQIQVIDQGIGMDPEDLDRIWERFYKVDESRKNTKFGESGIGLSLVRSLVEAHGGHISVTSQKGKGSTFTVRLPLRKESDET